MGIFNIKRDELKDYSIGEKRFLDIDIIEVIDYHESLNNSILNDGSSNEAIWDLKDPSWEEQIYNYINNCYEDVTEEEEGYIKNISSIIFTQYLKVLYEIETFERF